MHNHNHDQNCNHHHNHFEKGNKSGLIIALVITATIMLTEYIGGLLTNSLALLSDAGHMLSDTVALFLSIIAIWISTKSATSKKTFGFNRIEVIIALFNALALFAITIAIIWKSVNRIVSPQEVQSGYMIFIALVGLLSNAISAIVLMKKSDIKNNVNIKAAYLHIISDALGSLGAVLAGVIMYFTSWYMIDPILSVLVSLLIIKGAFGVVKETIHILLEGVPHDKDYSEIKNTLEKMEGVLNVHDLHIWTISSGITSLTCHILIQENKNEQDLLQEIINDLEKNFNIKHNTIQIEKSLLKHTELTI